MMLVGPLSKNTRLRTDGLKNGDSSWAIEGDSGLYRRARYVLGAGLLSASSSSDERSLSPCLFLCRYNNAFHSRTSSIFSSLLRYSSIFVGLVGSYISSQSVSSCAFCCFFFFLRPPRWRFSTTWPYFHASSSVAVQSARELLVSGGPEDDEEVAAGAAGVGTASVAPRAFAEEIDVALGKVATGLACLTGGRRMGWNRSAGSGAFLASTAPVWLYSTGAEDMVAGGVGSLGSKRLSYNEKGAFGGGGGGGGAIVF